MADIQIIGTPTCTKCKQLHRELIDFQGTKHNLSYIDISSLSLDEQNVITDFTRSFPVLKIDKEYHFNKTPQEYLKMVERLK